MKHPLLYILSICFFLHSKNMQAQYALTPIAPPPSFTFNDLWHFTVVRATTDNNAQFYVSLRIFDGSNNLKIKSNTATLILPVGSHYFNLSNLSALQPFITSYYDASLLQQTVASGGNFPPGVYNLIYTLYGKSADGEFVPLTEDASQAVIEVMWPPMLLTPPDQDTIDTQYPLLTWTPAFHSAFIGQIMYDLNLVELFPGQNPYQAIQSNPTYFSQNDIPTTMQQYPPAAQTLDTGKVYAWQVHANAQGTSMGSSEVWTFTLRTPAPEEAVVPLPVQYYFTLEAQYPDRFMEITDKQIRFRYLDSYNQSEEDLESFHIYKDGYEQPFVSGDSYDSTLHINAIYYKINLENNQAFVPGHYLLVVKNIKNRTFYLRVRYRDEE